MQEDFRSVEWVTEKRWRSGRLRGYVFQLSCGHKEYRPKSVGRDLSTAKCRSCQWKREANDPRVLCKVIACRDTVLGSSDYCYAHNWIQDAR